MKNNIDHLIACLMDPIINNTINRIYEPEEFDYIDYLYYLHKEYIEDPNIETMRGIDKKSAIIYIFNLIIKSDNILENKELGILKENIKKELAEKIDLINDDIQIELEKENISEIKINITTRIYEILEELRKAKEILLQSIASNNTLNTNIFLINCIDKIINLIQIDINTNIEKEKNPA